jgi:hypothetical protein
LHKKKLKEKNGRKENVCNARKYFLTDKQIEVFARGVSTLEPGLLEGGE